MRLRGDVKAVLYQLEQLLGPSALLDQLAGTLSSVASVAEQQGVRLQLDPSFQPHFDLYDGLVLKLVCHGTVAPVAIASGGRYDALVARFGGAAGGMGFSFDIEAIRDLLGTETTAPQRAGATLVAYATEDQLAQAWISSNPCTEPDRRLSFYRPPAAVRPRPRRSPLRGVAPPASGSVPRIEPDA